MNFQNSVLNFLTSNFKFNWPGLGRTARTDRRARMGPSPGQLKFYFFQLGLESPETAGTRPETVRNGPKTVRNCLKPSENGSKPSETIRNRLKPSETIRNSEVSVSLAILPRNDGLQVDIDIIEVIA